MKSLSEFLNESLHEEIGKSQINEGKITDEKSFREAAEAKFKEVFGDELDEQKMKDTIDGILKDNSDLVKDGKWGELIGILNKSFT